MVTRQVDNMDVERVERVNRTPVRTTSFGETKGSFMTTEFWGAVAAIAALLIATYQMDDLTATQGWRLVAFVVIGYMVSRGLAKAGTGHRDSDY
jgi:hypothetical protein